MTRLVDRGVKHATSLIASGSDFPIHSGFVDASCLKKVEQLSQKGLPKVIVDAERDRRTLEEPANQGVWFRGGTVS